MSAIADALASGGTYLKWEHPGTTYTGIITDQKGSWAFDIGEKESRDERRGLATSALWRCLQSAL